MHGPSYCIIMVCVYFHKGGARFLLCFIAMILLILSTTQLDGKSSSTLQTTDGRGFIRSTYKSESNLSMLNEKREHKT